MLEYLPPTNLRCENMDTQGSILPKVELMSKASNNIGRVSIKYYDFDQSPGVWIATFCQR